MLLLTDTLLACALVCYANLFAVSTVGILARSVAAGGRRGGGRAAKERAPTATPGFAFEVDDIAGNRHLVRHLEVSTNDTITTTTSTTTIDDGADRHIASRSSCSLYSLFCLFA